MRPRAKPWIYLLVALGFCAVVVSLLAGYAYATRDVDQTSIVLYIGIPDLDNPAVDVTATLVDSQGAEIAPMSDEMMTLCQGFCSLTPDQHAYSWSHPDLKGHAAPYTLTMTYHGTTLVSHATTEWHYCFGNTIYPATLGCRPMTPWYEMPDIQALFIVIMVVGLAKAVTYLLARVRRLSTWIALASFNSVALFFIWLFDYTARYGWGSVKIIPFILAVILWDYAWIRRGKEADRPFLLAFITGIVTWFIGALICSMYGFGLSLPLY